MTTSRPSLTSGAMTQNWPGMNCFRNRTSTSAILRLVGHAILFGRRFIRRAVVARFVIAVISAVVVVVRLFNAYVVQHDAEDVRANIQQLLLGPPYDRARTATSVHDQNYAIHKSRKNRSVGE